MYCSRYLPTCIYTRPYIYTLTFRSLYVSPRATDSDKYYRVSFGIRNLGYTKGKYEVDKKKEALAEEKS